MPKSLVLVVEDNPYNLELVQFLLEEAGHEVHSAAEADEVYQRVQANLPDLILMDMQLPGTDGLTLVEQLRADSSFDAVPIVALTAHALRGDRERFLKHGCDGYLAKPIDVSTFVAQVQEFLSGGRRPPTSVEAI